MEVNLKHNQLLQPTLAELGRLNSAVACRNHLSVRDPYLRATHPILRERNIYQRRGYERSRRLFALLGTAIQIYPNTLPKPGKDAPTHRLTSTTL